MEYPILIAGEQAGRLTVTRQGLFTVFEAEAEDRGALLRLSVFGGGAEGYLGIMGPENGVLCLKKRLSRTAMTDFPETIEYAGPAGGAAAPPAQPREAPSADAPAPAADGPAAPPAEECDTLWFSAPDGTLSAFDGRRMLIALPAEDPRVPGGAAAAVRRINGRDYVVFPR